MYTRARAQREQRARERWIIARGATEKPLDFEIPRRWVREAVLFLRGGGIDDLAGKREVITSGDYRGVIMRCHGFLFFHYTLRDSCLIT